MKYRELTDAFWSRTRIDSATGCVEWTGMVNAGGYGCVYVGGQKRKEYAHRLAYRALVGDRPAGLKMQIDHLCRNRRCVNVQHLELVPAWTNNIRGESEAARHAQATHCDRGHLFDEVNTIYRRDSRTGAIHRRCRTCEKAHAAKRVKYTSPVCPDCGHVCKTAQGVGSHRAMTHGRSDHRLRGLVEKVQAAETERGKARHLHSVADVPVCETDTAGVSG